MSIIEDREEMDREWLAWQRVTYEWERLGLPDFNDDKNAPLVKAIEHWGSQLVTLRMKQGKTYADEQHEEYLLACKKAELDPALIDMRTRTVRVAGRQVRPRA